MIVLKCFVRLIYRNTDTINLKKIQLEKERDTTVIDADKAFVNLFNKTTIM